GRPGLVESRHAALRDRRRQEGHPLRRRRAGGRQAAAGAAVERALRRMSMNAYLAPVGRALFALIFLISGAGHFSKQTIDYAAAAGVPLAGLAVRAPSCVLPARPRNAAARRSRDTTLKVP